MSGESNYGYSSGPRSHQVQETSVIGSSSFLQDSSDYTSQPQQSYTSWHQPTIETDPLAQDGDDNAIKSEEASEYQELQQPESDIATFLKGVDIQSKMLEDIQRRVKEELETKEEKPDISHSRSTRSKSRGNRRRRSSSRSRRRHKRSRSRSRDRKSRHRSSRSKSRDRKSRRHSSRSKSRERKSRRHSSRSKSRDRKSRRNSSRSRSRSRDKRRRRRRSKSRSRTSSRSRSYSKSKSRSRSRDRKRRKSEDKTAQMLKIRREVEAMYDNAMQAMIRQKEEEYAKLQALMAGVPGFSEAMSGYSTGLPPGQQGSVWNGSAGRILPPCRDNQTTSVVASLVASTGALPGLPTFGELGLDKKHGMYQILLEIKNRFFPVVDLNEIPDHLVTFTTTAEGSKFLQENLERASIVDREIIFKRMSAKTIWLSMNVFGNYVIQKFFEIGTPAQVHALFSKLLPETRKVTLNKYASRVVQIAFSYINQEDHATWIEEINKDIVAYCRDTNANHVIQRCMETAENLNSPLMLMMLQRINEVAVNLCTDRFGCRVLQKVIQLYKDEHRKAVITAVLQMMKEMTSSPYGNYVVQDLMEYGNTEDRSLVFRECLANVLSLSRNKFGSNVIENLMRKGSPEEKIQIVRELCEPSNLELLMKDQFGNYVAQRMVEYSDADVIQVIHEKILVVIKNDITPIINEKMVKNIAVNLMMPSMVELSKVYLENMSAFEHINQKHADILDKAQLWLTKIKDRIHFSEMGVEPSEVSRLVEVLADINGNNENTDLESLKTDLRSYVKCLIQDYCKKCATFLVKVNNTKELMESQGLHFKKEPQKREDGTGGELVIAGDGRPQGYNSTRPPPSNYTSPGYNSFNHNWNNPPPMTGLNMQDGYTRGVAPPPDNFRVPPPGLGGGADFSTPPPGVQIGYSTGTKSQPHMKASNVPNAVFSTFSNNRYGW